MSVRNEITDHNDAEVLMDDISDVKVPENTEPNVDEAKLSSLKAKLADKKKNDMKIVEKKTRSIAFGVIGSGQGGSRLAECLYNEGYDTVVLNTASQDLKFIKIPEANKLLLDYSLGGAAKELEIGRAAAEMYRPQITELLHSRLGASQVNILCLSLGGGSGAGSCETLVDILSGLGKPLIVITVLPMSTEDAQTKSNSLETLSKLAKLTETKKVSNLIVVDNAKIETIYQDINQLDFYPMANRAIVEPIEVFNTLSSMPSGVKGLDPTEMAKLFIDGEGLSIYGEMKVTQYTENTAIAEAVIENLNSNLLASGFDLKQSKYVGVMFVAPERVWRQIPNVAVNYALEMINEQCGTPKGVFKGIYTVESDEDCVKVYSIFSGLGLPGSRITQLKAEVAQHTETIKNRDSQRNLSLQLDTGKNETVSEAQKIREKIAAKSSNFGKLMGSVVDKRK